MQTNSPRRHPGSAPATQARPYTLDDDDLVRIEQAICFALRELEQAEARRRSILARLAEGEEQ